MPIDTNPAQPNPQGAGADGGEKLIFGKYKSIEEAEKGYKELEQGFHSTRKDLSELKNLVETRLPEQPQYGDNYRSSYVPSGRPTADPELASKVLSELYSDPVGTLSKVVETAAQVAEKQFEEKLRKQAASRERVTSWAAKNPDLSEHKDLLDYYVRQTDARLAPESRLDQAAEQVRKRLVELRGSQQSAAPKPGDFIPPPGGSRGSIPAQQQDQTPDMEAEAVKRIQERNANRIKALNVRGRK